LRFYHKGAEVIAISAIGEGHCLAWHILG